MRLHGVNLGGWLVLERWMTPSLFAGLAAADETAWCLELGREESARRARAHRESFVARADLAWLVGVGVDAVRIPVGHWILGAPYPYHERYGSDPHPYADGGIDALDRALGWAEELGLRVVLDLHAAPGCQNGFDNGGLAGVCDWHRSEAYLEHSVDVLGRLAQRYRASRALCGIEVLNEPRWDVPTELLVRYTRGAAAAIRAHCAAERVAIVFHDGFRSHREYATLSGAGGIENAVLDVHRYQCFEPVDLALDLAGHVRKADGPWRAEAEAIPRELGLPAIVGEWSLGLGPPLRSDAEYRAFGAAQLRAFEPHLGWFFWSYRTEVSPEWSFRDCVLRGWLPARIQ